MAEYIKREDVLAKAAPVQGYLCNMISSWDVVHTPTADVASVVHGWWIVDKAGRCSCSECRGEGMVNIVTMKLVAMPYCQHCGAKMDGG